MSTILDTRLLMDDFMQRYIIHYLFYIYYSFRNEKLKSLIGESLPSKE